MKMAEFERAREHAVPRVKFVSSVCHVQLEERGGDNRPTLRLMGWGQQLHMRWLCEQCRHRQDEECYVQVGGVGLWMSMRVALKRREEFKARVDERVGGVLG
jgi:hypothetical protein